MGSRASEGIQVPVRTGRLDLASVTKKIFKILLQEDLSIPVNKSGRPVPHLPRNLTQIGKILLEKKSKFKILTTNFCVDVHLLENSCEKLAFPRVVQPV